VKVFAARFIQKPKQVEVLFRARANAQVKPQTVEVERAEWFATRSLYRRFAARSATLHRTCCENRVN
jgi:hypothetical protein